MQNVIILSFILLVLLTIDDIVLKIYEKLQSDVDEEVEK
jgi:hypothetical protein